MRDLKQSTIYNCILKQLISLLVVSQYGSIKVKYIVRYFFRQCRNLYEMSHIAEFEMYDVGGQIKAMKWVTYAVTKETWKNPGMNGTWTLIMAWTKYLTLNWLYLKISEVKWEKRTIIYWIVDKRCRQNLVVKSWNLSFSKDMFLKYVLHSCSSVIFFFSFSQSKRCSLHRTPQNSSLMKSNVIKFATHVVL